MSREKGKASVASGGDERNWSDWARGGVDLRGQGEYVHQNIYAKQCPQDSCKLITSSKQLFLLR